MSSRDEGLSMLSVCSLVPPKLEIRILSQLLRMFPVKLPARCSPGYKCVNRLKKRNKVTCIYITV